MFGDILTENHVLILFIHKFIYSTRAVEHFFGPKQPNIVLSVLMYDNWSIIAVRNWQSGEHHSAPPCQILNHHHCQCPQSMSLKSHVGVRIKEFTNVFHEYTSCESEFRAGVVHFMDDNHNLSQHNQAPGLVHCIDQDQDQGQASAHFNRRPKNIIEPHP